MKEAEQINEIYKVNGKEKYIIELSEKVKFLCMKEAEQKKMISLMERKKISLSFPKRLRLYKWKKQNKEIEFTRLIYNDVKTIFYI